ncbi:bifunctional diguanylate cyclase/phosphodiesterase [Sulfurimonas paralvinellae]|nr:EAL domain-containing protein [Sulfurimonas paralvinellae]
MTLFKQMALALSLLIIIILGSVMAINYETAKEDMLESLYQTTVNNISSLTNKLSETGGEPAVITSIIDSEFDSGYYKRIKFISNDASFKYEQVDNDPIENVPEWFVNFADIHLKPVTADVTSGWNIIGTVTIEADTTIVYESLYQISRKLFYLFIIFVTVSLVLLNILLHYILKPLKRIQHQAEAILNNEFVIETKEPYTTEFKEVSHAMNAMVKKVEEIFNKANEAAKRNKELLYNDPVTKLYNRRYLMLRLPELLTLETKNQGGSILLVALNGADILNKQLGRKDADAFFAALAQNFIEECEDIEEKVIARVNGTEFTLMLPDCESYLSESIARSIFECFLDLADDHGVDTSVVYINIGIYRYRPGVSISDLLTRVDDALTKAKADERQHIYVYEEKNEKNALPKEQWRNILEESIEKNYFSLKFWPTMDVKTKTVNHKVMTFTIDDGKDKQFYYGDFIAPAINLGLVGKMYLVTLKDLLTKRHSELTGTICSIRLSNEFLKDSKAFEELSKLFYHYGKKLDFKLSFEVADSFAIHNTATVKGFVDLFKEYRYGFGINAFSGESNDFHYLKELNPEFIKADVSFLLDQTEESMNSLEVITKSLGIDLIATFVKDKQELETLQKLHIDKVQGPITDTF